MFSNYFFRYQKLSKKWDLLLIFEKFCQYVGISKTSSEKFDCRTSRICWKITKILKNVQKIHALLFVFETPDNGKNRTFCWFLVPKIVFWKNHYWVATTTDCFEPIFGFLGSFCFEKHRSASWSRIGMFSELWGRSVPLPTPRNFRPSYDPGYHTMYVQFLCLAD